MDNINLVIALKHQDQMVNLVTALKNQITQMYQLVTNQIDMTNSHEFRDTAEQTALLTNQVKLMKKCLKIELLTNQVGAAQKKTTVPIVAKTKAYEPLQFGGLLHMLAPSPAHHNHQRKPLFHP